MRSSSLFWGGLALTVLLACDDPEGAAPFADGAGGTSGVGVGGVGGVGGKGVAASGEGGSRTGGASGVGVAGMGAAGASGGAGTAGAPPLSGGAAGTSGGAGAGAGGLAGATGGAAGATGGAAGATGGTAGTTGGAGASATAGASGSGAGGAVGGGGTALAPSCEAPSGTAKGEFRLVAGTGSLPSPVLVQGAPGDDDRIFVVLQGGTVRVLVGGVLNADPFYVVPELATGGERGLLGLAFHPKYAENGRFYLHYSRKGDGATVVEERVRGADADHASTAADAGRTVLVVPQPEANHNGGALSFGPDGFLYLGLGDGGGGGDKHGAIGNGQDQGTLLGKILRLNVDQTDGGAAYGIPPGNLTGAGVRAEIWDLGLRNPWRFSFDACTGDLWIGDVGQGQWEEIDFEPAGEGRRNYGWRAREGRHCYDPALCASDAPQAGLVDPVLEYKHENGRCSIAGGYVYRGSRIPALRGTYFYGDYCTHEIFATRRVDGAVLPAENVTTSLGAGNFGNLLSFGQDNAGELYAATTNGVFRLEAAE